MFKPTCTFGVGCLLLTGIATSAEPAPKIQVVESVELNTQGVAVDPQKVIDLKASEEKWKATKEACGGHYSYVVSSSSFSGARWSTTIVVKENKVVERSYLVQGPPVPVAPGEDPAPVKPAWVETGKEIGSHKEGAAARTVDELYAVAAKIVATPIPPDHRLGLGFDKQGLLSFCFTQDTRIADDIPTHGVPWFVLELPKQK